MRCNQHYAGCYRLFCDSAYGVVHLRLLHSRTLAGYPGIVGRLLVLLRLLRGSIRGEIDPKVEYIQPFSCSSGICGVGRVVSNVPVEIEVSPLKTGPPKSGTVPAIAHEVETAALIHHPVAANISKRIWRAARARNLFAKRQVGVAVDHVAGSIGHLAGVARCIEAIVSRRTAGRHSTRQTEAERKVRGQLA